MCEFCCTPEVQKLRDEWDAQVAANRDEEERRWAIVPDSEPYKPEVEKQKEDNLLRDLVIGWFFLG